MPAGDCFKVAAQLGQLCADEPDLDRSEVLVVHGIVTGGAGRVAGIRYWHAWVEMKTSAGWIVLDHSNDKQLNVKRASYYRAARIDQREIWRFTIAEARHCLGVVWGTWGPWVDGWENIGEEHLIEGALDIYTERSERS